MSVIVPVYNGEATLAACLEALTASSLDDFELIVVDDRSTDRSASIATDRGARVISQERRRGPGAARNLGAMAASGEVLVFVDADVCVHADALERIVDGLDHPTTEGPAAIFGSYDDRPTAVGVVSRFKNLQHHYIHSINAGPVDSFWSGCGAVRRDAFEAVGGFDEMRTDIEDIELGQRLADAGYEIVLNPEIRGTHLKRWTLANLIRVDLQGRAIPWLRLLRERPWSRRLNTDLAQRASVAFVYLALTALLGAVLALWASSPPVGAAGLGIALVAVLATIGLNLGLYRTFARSQGYWFTLRAIPVHLLYFGYCGVAVIWVLILPRRVVRERPERSPATVG